MEKELPPRLLLDLSRGCNLRCSMCPVHGSGGNHSRERAGEIMPSDELRKILGETGHANPLVQPCLYGEPLLGFHFRENIALMKQMGASVVINTNGLSLREDLARFLIEIGLDSLFFSLDAATEETYSRIRGVNKLKKAVSAVMMMLKLRDDRLYPRIGVTFVRQEDNLEEEKDFISFWSQHVDVIRLNALIVEGAHDRFSFAPLPRERVPCQTLYETMPILFDGDVSLCCRDSFGRFKMGNVFQESVAAVWNGPVFQKVRQLHEQGEWHKIPLCAQCDGWAQTEYKEEARNGLLVRKSPLAAYYNMKSRLANWEGGRGSGVATVFPDPWSLTHDPC